MSNQLTQVYQEMATKACMCVGGGMVASTNQ